jgi:hypothetical protein
LQIKRCLSRRGNHDEHHLTAEVEGDLIHLGIVGDGQLAMNLLMLQNGAAENVFQSGLKVTVEEGELQYGVLPTVAGISNFSTGNDSPVRLAWIKNKSLQPQDADIDGDHIAGSELDRDKVSKTTALTLIRFPLF